MNWLNINVATLRSEQYIGSEPIARATWLNVLSWCCEQENQGRIEGAKEWGDRRWQQTCGVTLSEVSSAAPLLTWDGSDLVVWNYPADKQAEVQAKREGGREGGLKSAKSRAKKKPKTQLQAEVQGELQAGAKVSPNGMEREGKEKGKEGEENKTVGQSRSAVASPASDADWLKSLKDSPAYAGIDVDREFAKMTTWCATNSKLPSRRRFINWLNRVEKPLAAGSSNAPTWTPPLGGF